MVAPNSRLGGSPCHLSFPFFLYLAAFAGAVLASAVSLPLWRVACHRLELVDDPGHRKIHSHTIPLAGGLAVFTGLALPVLLAAAALAFGWMDIAAIHPVQHGFERRGFQVLALLAGALGMLVVGLLDDRFELPPAAKFGGQLAVAALVAASGTRITLFVPNLLFSYAVTILWMLTIVNALNFMDNMNGLCAGLGFIGSFGFALHAAAAGQYLVATFGLLACGSLLGYLPYNFPKASVFLGDSGSHLVGYLLAVMGILPHFYSSDAPARWAVLTPILILAVPLFDLVSVVIIRWRLGKPFYIGDTNHLSHRLVRRGFSRSHAVLLLWLAATLACALAIVL